MYKTEEQYPDNLLVGQFDDKDNEPILLKDLFDDFAKMIRAFPQTDFEKIEQNQKIKDFIVDKYQSYLQQQIEFIKNNPGKDTILGENLLNYLKWIIKEATGKDIKELS